MSAMKAKCHHYWQHLPEEEAAKCIYCGLVRRASETVHDPKACGLIACPECNPGVLTGTADCQHYFMRGVCEDCGVKEEIASASDVSHSEQNGNFVQNENQSSNADDDRLPYCDCGKCGSLPAASNTVDEWVIDPVTGKCAPTGLRLTAGLSPSARKEVIKRCIVAKTKQPASANTAGGRSSSYDAAREAAGTESVRVYEMTMMNTDTPRQSGAHYMSWGAKWGFDSGIEWALENSPQVKAMTSAIDGALEYLKSCGFDKPQTLADYSPDKDMYQSLLKARETLKAGGR